jgi:hypothetical protein
VDRGRRCGGFPRTASRPRCPGPAGTQSGTAVGGIREVRPCLRGGVVSWGWSAWAFADTEPYRGVYDDGSTVGLLANYYAQAFGLFVFTRCEAKAKLGDAGPDVSFPRRVGSAATPAMEVFHERQG